MTVHHQLNSSNHPLSSNGASDSASGVGSNNLTVGEEGVGSGATTNNTSPSRSQGAAASQASAQQPGPKPVYKWSVVDVQKWLRRYCADLFHLYSELFLNQDITGRSLVRLNENSLLRLGIVHPQHRQEILLNINKLRVKSVVQVHMEQIKEENLKAAKEKQQEMEDASSSSVSTAGAPSNRMS